MCIPDLLFTDLVAFCGGRTLLSETNFWLVDYASIAAGDPCARHALLSIASAYVLDYTQDSALLKRANHHYEKAVKLLGDALSDPSAQDIGKADNLVCSIILLASDDVSHCRISLEDEPKLTTVKLLNWELRRNLKERQADGRKPQLLPKRSWTLLTQATDIGRIPMYSRHLLG